MRSHWSRSSSGRRCSRSSTTWRRCMARSTRLRRAEIGGGVKALSLQTASPHLFELDLLTGGRVVPDHRHPDARLVTGQPDGQLGSAVMGGLQGLPGSLDVGNASAAAATAIPAWATSRWIQRTISPSTSNPWVGRQQDLDGNFGSRQRPVAHGPPPTCAMRALHRALCRHASHSRLFKRHRGRPRRREVKLSPHRMTSPRSRGHDVARLSRFRSTTRGDGGQ